MKKGGKRNKKIENTIFANHKYKIRREKNELNLEIIYLKKKETDEKNVVSIVLKSGKGGKSFDLNCW